MARARKTPDVSPEEAVESYMQKRQAKGDGVRKKSRGLRQYAIRYGVVDPHALSQWGIVWQHPGYSRPPAPQPNNGEHGAKQISPPLDYNKKRPFYDGLLASVRAEGVRNPLFAVAYKDGTYVRYGCSRMWAARRTNQPIPVVIADYAEAWDELEELHTAEDVLAVYVDKPALVEIEDDYMRIDGCP